MCVWVYVCAVCRGTGGGGGDDGGFHGYCGIPACCQCDGGGVILRPRCCPTKRKTRMKRRKKKRRFSSAVQCPVAPCRIHLRGDPVHLPEESAGVRLHIGAPPQSPVEGSGWDHPVPLVLSRERWDAKVRKKHHYGPQGGDRHSSALSPINILNRNKQTIRKMHRKNMKSKIKI